MDSIYPEPPKKSKQEKGEGDKILLKSNWRLNERGQEKIDALNKQRAVKKGVRNSKGKQATYTVFTCVRCAPVYNTHTYFGLHFAKKKKNRNW